MNQDDLDTEIADSETGELTPAPAPAKISELASVQTEGSRSRRAFMMKQFLPDPEWITKNVVAHGRGKLVTVGRIWGFCTGVEEKANEYKGQALKSIMMKGVFKTLSYVTDLEGDCTSIYIPLAYSEKVAAAFAADPGLKLVEIDCDVGIEATGKTIPYEWAVTAFREGEEMAILTRLRESRGRPRSAPAPALPAPAAAPVLEGVKAK